MSPKRQSLAVIMGFFSVMAAIFSNDAFSNAGALLPYEFASSLNPVGSGARAIGRGGAFIAVADDATAASWNPAGLIQLKRKPEMSVVTSGYHREEDNHFGTHNEASGKNTIVDGNINYLSFAGAFELLGRNMSAAITYQHSYDFNREWDFTMHETETSFSMEDKWEYRQTGNLTAIGLSYCVQVIPKLSLGMTLNIWEDALTDNHWNQEYKASRKIILANLTVPHEIRKFEAYSLSGANVNVGMLWRVTRQVSVGAVLKTPFDADIEHAIRYEETSVTQEETIKTDTRNESLAMPMSYGVGFVYKYSDAWSVSADIYKTAWDDFVVTDYKGDERSPVSGRLATESDVDPTVQIRLGAEYLHVNPLKRNVVSLRTGIFYDPAPAEGSPDEYYGFSLGTGFTAIDWFSFDIAYQFRYGNEVGGSYLEMFGFTQDVREHMAYASMIFYMF